MSDHLSLTLYVYYAPDADTTTFRVYFDWNDVYNIYQDCYQQSSKVFGTRIKSHQRRGIVDYFVDQGRQVSTYSTDNQGGFQCYASDAAAQYLNQDVKRENGAGVTILSLLFRYRTQIAGYVKQFTYGSASIDLLTVKGAGHLVPSDRPGPALQMFENFLRSQDYSKELPFSYQLHPLKQEYQIQETVTGERTEVPVPGSVSTRKLKLKSRRMSKNKSTAYYTAFMALGMLTKKS
ncbi:hypothetical protein ANCDUO_04288 [Ancylostoma duodenale]|uniref:Serine carboxypeptidase n=1 Tax=Ancylostoma duodenale TaxID=51022 RepID=A0A0C2DRM8_9BILA|nr:hypothetical protein ANCDUO_04288 [Ancylostoma duodenale]